jgi:hypothetical protein
MDLDNNYAAAHTQTGKHTLMHICTHTIHTHTHTTHTQYTHTHTHTHTQMNTHTLAHTIGRYVTYVVTIDSDSLDLPVN